MNNSETGRVWRLTSDAGDVSLIVDRDTQLADLLLAHAMWDDCELAEVTA